MSKCLEAKLNMLKYNPLWTKCYLKTIIKRSKANKDLRSSNPLKFCAQTTCSHNQTLHEFKLIVFISSGEFNNI